MPLMTRFAYLMMRLIDYNRYLVDYSIPKIIEHCSTKRRSVISAKIDIQWNCLFLFLLTFTLCILQIMCSTWSD